MCIKYLKTYYQSEFLIAFYKTSIKSAGKLSANYFCHYAFLNTY